MPPIPIYSSGNAVASNLAATEAPDGIRTTFTFAAASVIPSYIVGDGIWYRATDAAGNTDWTWAVATNIATILFPAPLRDIYAVE